MLGRHIFSCFEAILILFLNTKLLYKNRFFLPSIPNLCSLGFAFDLTTSKQIPHVTSKLLLVTNQYDTLNFILNTPRYSI